MKSDRGLNLKKKHWFIVLYYYVLIDAAFAPDPTTAISTEQISFDEAHYVCYTNTLSLQ